MYRLVAGDNPLAVEFDAGDAARRGTSGDDDLCGLERLRVALEHVHLAIARKARGPLDPINLVLLEEELDALREPGDDLVLACLHLVHVDAWCAFRQRHAPRFRVLNDLERVCVLEQRLGWNTSPDQTGSAERLLFLDDCHFLSELGGSNRGDVPSGSGADYDNVVHGSRTYRTQFRSVKEAEPATPKRREGGLYSRRWHVRTRKDHSRRRRRRGNAGHADRHAQARLPRPARGHRRSCAADDGKRGRRPDAARRPPARHQRLRGAQDRQRELPLRRGDRHLGDQGSSRRRSKRCATAPTTTSRRTSTSRACARWSPTPASVRT